VSEELLARLTLRQCRKCRLLYFLGYNSHEDICLACAQEEKNAPPFAR
jgi:hypothetical protein